MFEFDATVFELIRSRCVDFLYGSVWLRLDLNELDTRICLADEKIEWKLNFWLLNQVRGRNFDVYSVISSSHQYD